MLAGYARDADVSVPDGAVHHLQGAPAVAVGELVEGVDDLVEVVAQGVQHVADGGRVPGQDLGPEPGVAARDPGHVAQSLPGQGHRRVGDVAQPAGDEAGGHLRDVRDDGDRRVVLGGAHDADGGADGERPPGGRRSTASGRLVPVGTTTHARPSKRSPRAAPAPERSRPAMGCDPT